LSISIFEDFAFKLRSLIAQNLLWRAELAENLSDEYLGDDWSSMVRQRKSLGPFSEMIY
jgi:hypothetical protein